VGRVVRQTVRRKRESHSVDVFGWLASLPLFDRALAALLRWPRALAGVVIVLGLAVTAGSTLPLWTGASYPLVRSAPATSVPTGEPVPEEAAAQQQVLAVVVAYNQASISAAQLGRVELLEPYLARDGEVWREAQAEYKRRRQRGETSDASLVRWGVLRLEIENDTATLETQEQWDVLTTVGPTVISSRRGVLARNRYELRRTDADAWRIVVVKTTPVIGS
jgi:hypothetical protein